jgi:hypothetical protein
MLILKYNLTAEEYFDFSYYTAWAAPEKKGYRLRYALRYVFWYAVLAGVYLFAVLHEHSPLSISLFAATVIVYYLLVPTLVKRGIRQRVRSTLAEPENKHILEESEIVLMDTGIIDKDTASETKYTWEAIVRKAETPTSYYLYTNTYHAIVIPKRLLNDPQEKEELQRLLNQYLPLSSEFPES